MSQTIPEPPTVRSRIADLTKAEQHSLFISERRCILCGIFAEQTAEISFDELVSKVARRDQEIDSDIPEQVERVAITLHHTHLPKLEEFGIIAYNIETDQVLL